MGAERLSKAGDTQQVHDNLSHAIVLSDSLAEGYSVAADEHGVPEAWRASAMLFSVAEGHLEGGDVEEALEVAERAVQSFREHGDAAGLADSLRLFVHAHLASAEVVRNFERQSDVRDTMRLAENLTQEELNLFRESNDCRGQGAMLLAYAEINGDRRGSKKREKAYDALQEALEIFSAIDDQKYYGQALIELSNIEAKQGKPKDSIATAKEAVEVFKKIGDTKFEAKAIATYSCALARGGDFGGALREGKKALDLEQRLGNKRNQGMGYHHNGSYALFRGDAQTALGDAMVARSLFKETEAGKGGGLEVSAVHLVCEAHCQMFESYKAVEIASTFLEQLQHAVVAADATRATYTENLRRDVLDAYTILAKAHQANEHYEGALMTAQEALALCREMKVPRKESDILAQLAWIHIDLKLFEDAKRYAYQSCEIYRDLGGAKGECEVRMHLLADVLREADDAEGAALATEEARALASKTSDRRLEGTTMLAECYSQLGLENYEKAMKAATLATEIFQEIQDAEGQANAWEMMSHVYMEVGDDDRAERAGQRAVSLLKDHPDKFRLAEAKYQLARVQMPKDASAAARVSMENLRESRTSGDKRSALRALFMLIDSNLTVLLEEDLDQKPVRIIKEACKKLIRHAKEALQIACQLGDKSGQATAHVWIAHIELILQDFNVASKSLDFADPLLVEVSDKAGQAKAAYLRAQVYINKADVNAAVKKLEEAASLAQAVGDERLINEVRYSYDAWGLSSDMTSDMPALTNLVLYDEENADPARTAKAILDKSDDSRSEREVKQYILRSVRQLLGNDLANNIVADTPLADAGVDSLASVELRTQFQAEFRITVPSSFMLYYPTINSMTQLIVEELRAKKIQEISFEKSHERG